MIMTTPDSGLMSGTSTTNQTTNGWDSTSSTATNNPLASALWTAPTYFGANTNFSASNPYASSDFGWTSQWNAAYENRFPMTRLPTTPSYFINSINAGIGGAMRNTGRRRRNLFSQKQVQILRRAFEQEEYVKPEHREMLAKETGLTPQQVKIWFQNNRYKCKQKRKEDERQTKVPGGDDMDRKYNMDNSPCSSGNDLSMNSHNSPEQNIHIKLEDSVNNIENPEIKSIPYPDMKDPNLQNSSFSHFGQMYPYGMPGMPFSNLCYNPAAAAYQTPGAQATNIYQSQFQ